MRILLLNYEYPPVGGGAATATREIARALRRLGHAPVVLTARFGELPERADEDGVTVVRLPCRRLRPDAASLGEMASYFAAAWPAVGPLVRQERIGAMLAFFSLPCGPLAWRAHRGTGIPYVVSLRGGDVPGNEPGLRFAHALLAPVRRRVLRGAAAVIANSPGLRALAEAADGVPVRVIPNGVDPAFFRPAAPAPHSPAPLRLLFVGRFHPQKNLPWLLRQLADFAGELPASFTLDLVGEGPRLPELRTLAAELGLQDRLRWRGWVPRSELPALYQGADVVLHPTLYEGMPNVLLEAMACGVAVVASDVPGNDAVVRPGETGFLHPLDDGAAFRSILRRLVAEPGLAPALGAAGRRAVERDFSWERTAQSYLELLLPAV